ncbi:MFS domain-containing protein [Fusarium keratoplasticum]|uniref:MFS domain-containing protein n=1 Tax=Fusarium keratoplasticum TaxID=1328300 RepID=A0ACC0QF81_9HYPO|nr:MFS domain-containing protein [Fusarium keratoplasticum]KAI8652661.1 MFS domain-containing protein [Fusarium keratoplasticum]KAI8653381.1 MFS domain-containing protein [Fusarium keratoplasticum]
MQSLLQYRRAAAAAQAQIDRDVEKARGNLLPDTKRKGAGQGPSDEEKKEESGPDSSISNEGTADIEEYPVPMHRNTTNEAIQQCHSAGVALSQVLTGIHVRDHDARGHDEKIFVVDWQGPDDPLNPQNWSLGRRIGVTLQISVIAVFVGAASGIDAAVLPQAAHSLGVSEVAESLATGLYLVGMGLGSLVAGPFSETFGRNAVYTVSMAVFMIWIMAAGLAPNFGAQITFRFLAGCSASTPLVCSGGSIADMYNSLEKTWSFPLYAITCFGGPMIGAVMGAYIGPSTTVSWRWTEWSILISSGLVLVLVLLFMPETYGPLLLQWKAAHYRRITGDDRFRCEHEITDASLFSRLKVSMTRPFLMLTEPIIIAMTLYISVLYIVLFTFLVGWPYIFEYTYDLDQGLANIIFIAMFIGTYINFVSVPFVYQKTAKAIRSEGKTKFQPEIRLWYAMLGAAIAIPVSLFWLGWTNYSHISIWSAILAVVVFGYGVTGVFICVYMYIIDSYEIYAASALTFVALTRYVIAGGMTVVGIPFYENMGTHYTLTIMACISVVLAAIPYILYFHGHSIRAKSRYAVAR